MITSRKNLAHQGPLHEQSMTNAQHVVTRHTHFLLYHRRRGVTIETVLQLESVRLAKPAWKHFWKGTQNRPRSLLHEDTRETLTEKPTSSAAFLFHSVTLPFVSTPKIGAFAFSIRRDKSSATRCCSAVISRIFVISFQAHSLTSHGHIITNRRIRKLPKHADITRGHLTVSSDQDR